MFIAKDGARIERVTSQNPLQLLLLLDNSNSMGELAKGQSLTPAAKATEAIKEAILNLQTKARGSKPWLKLTIIRFGSEVVTMIQEKQFLSIDTDEIEGLDGKGGQTDMAAALRAARKFAEQFSAQTGAEAFHPPEVVLVTDGMPYVGFGDTPQDEKRNAENASNETRKAAEELRAVQHPNGKVLLGAVGFGAANDAFLSSIVSGLTKPGTNDPEVDSAGRPLPRYVRKDSWDALLQVLPPVGSTVGALGNVRDGTPR
jgi:uncharacterized protein YegL